MTVNITTLQFLLPLLLPIPIAFLSGLLRQDKFVPFVNEIIAWALVFLISLVSVSFGIGGHLTGNAQLDFLTITAYSGLLAHSSLLKPMQMYLQSNLLSLGTSAASQVEQTTIADVKAALDNLTAFLTGNGTTPVLPPAPPVNVPQFTTMVPQPAVTSAQVPQFQYAPTSTFPLPVVSK